MPELTAEQWEGFLQSCSQAHVLQTGAWGELKAGFGWHPIRIAVQVSTIRSAGAQVLLRRTPLGFSIAYLPKGPLSSHDSGAQPDWPALWAEIDQACRRNRAILLLAEPDAWEGQSMPAYDIPGFQPASSGIQPRRTIVVDLSGDEEELLGRMKQKTRYNIRLAAKKDVHVQASKDIDTFNRLMAVTGERDQFGVHTPAYYRRAYELFHARGACELFLAEYNGEALAGLLVFAHGRCAWYFYGASNDLHRERMPAYLLQWEAMRWARQLGCTQYDLWGVPDEDEAILEAGFMERSDGLWGVYRFKRGFGGVLQRSAAPLERVYRPVLHRFYSVWMRRAGEAA